MTTPHSVSPSDSILLHGSVLLIDGSAETDAVLRAVLEPRGAQVRRTRHQNTSGGADRPDVVVIDLDEAGVAAAECDWADTPHVVISSQRIAVNDAHARFLEKPFQYPALIRAVEELLEARPAA